MSLNSLFSSAEINSACGFQAGNGFVSRTLPLFENHFILSSKSPLVERAFFAQKFRLIHPVFLPAPLLPVYAKPQKPLTGKTTHGYASKYLLSSGTISCQGKKEVKVPEEKHLSFAGIQTSRFLLILWQTYSGKNQ